MPSVQTIQAPIPFTKSSNQAITANEKFMVLDKILDCREGNKMENQIVCPNCNKKISNHPLIDAAAKGEGFGSQSLNCDCGEDMNYCQIRAQLRDQKTVRRRF